MSSLWIPGIFIWMYYPCLAIVCFLNFCGRGIHPDPQDFIVFCVLYHGLSASSSTNYQCNFQSSVSLNSNPRCVRSQLRLFRSITCSKDMDLKMLMLVRNEKLTAIEYGPDLDDACGLRFFSC
nr:hypothetical protein Iba_chr04eCG1510 [Ipomoea batatas]